MTGITYSENGFPRFKLADGSFITSNKSIVNVLTANYATYYLNNPSYVYLKKADTYYKDLSFKVKGESINKGAVIKTSGISFMPSLGIPRLVTSNGFLTANKNYVEKITSHYEKYYTDVKKVQLLIDDYYYNSTNFIEQNRSVKIEKGQVIEVIDVEFDTNGYPRLKTSNGYITANKSFVKSL
ncbi:DUF5776 domain-containing protein [Enterococcus massiliensis]|uniref:DUF5776 domain-containing protein n=1 Tax=Enterococcus massiliensis TaxID=1640685 RepID=UPI00065E19FD|nr:DUF5776 domain-containing protein [Enterococcus massiliensis]